MSTTSFRLPRSVVPRRYTLRLVPDLDGATFAGEVAIEVELLEALDEIVLHAVDLDITEAALEPLDSGGLPRLGAAVSLDADSETAALVLDATAGPGLWEIRARFTGVLNDKLVGFYRSTYTDDAGEHTLATTQFQAPYARHAFPCFDEPDFKAIFAVTLVVDDGLLAVSNGAEHNRERLSDGRWEVSFTETIPMSTYLVAFVLGRMEATDPVDVDGVPVRVVHPPGKGHLTSFAIDTAAAALRYFREYFDLPYPADKLDLIAVPDFAFGAMENLGCVTFREVLVLVDPDTATQPELQRVADVINHELAHMWFGDLVTMKWWNGIWLNEAFATFMEMRATDDQRPEWKRWVDFGLSRTAAFDVDALLSTRPIEFDVHSPADAEGMFDLLTYEKGAAVVRMLEQHLGEDPFREGIRRYMRTHRLANTETTDLWDAIEAETGAPARQIMDSWIYTEGFPGVDVALSGSTLTLDASRFTYADRADDERPDATWTVPVGYRSDAGVGQVLLEESTTIELPQEPEWLVVNAAGAGFFRVIYQPEHLLRLADNAQHALDPIERYSLVDDHWAAVLSGRASGTSFLELCERLAAGGERDLSVWQRMLGGLEGLARTLHDDAAALLTPRVQHMVEPVWSELATAADLGDRDRQLAATIFATLGILCGDDATARQARELIATESTDPGLASAALRVFAATADDGDFDHLLAGFRDSPTPQEELRHLNAMAEVTDTTLMARLLELIDTEVRSQNAPYVLAAALTNRSLAPMVWTHVKDNWTTMIERFPSNSIVRLVSGVRTVSDPVLAADIRGFFATNEVPSGEKTLVQHLERMDISVALAAREAEALGVALA
jgi:puromycin-sensitive aminopeptidase